MKVRRFTFKFKFKFGSSGHSSPSTVVACVTEDGCSSAFGAEKAQFTVD